MLAPSDYFDLARCGHGCLFSGLPHAWDALARLEEYLAELLRDNPAPGPGLVMEGAILLGKARIYLGAGSRIEPGAMMVGPAWIGRDSEIRHGAYLRGNVLVGDGCVVGHATEAKNAIFLNGSHAAHFNYVGDSILGAGVNLGAGTRLSNLPMMSERDPSTGRRPTIRLRTPDGEVDTGLAKLGAILGDDAQTGCNVVTNPGCLIGPRTLVYSQVSVLKGCYPADRILKLRQVLETVERRPGAR